MQYTESSRQQVKRVIRAAHICYQGLYRADPFAAFRYADSLDSRIKGLVEACAPIESRHDWPLAERRIMGLESVPVMWALDPSRLPA